MRTIISCLCGNRFEVLSVIENEYVCPYCKRAYQRIYTDAKKGEYTFRVKPKGGD